jgi:hypothetical protein
MLVLQLDTPKLSSTFCNFSHKLYGYMSTSRVPVLRTTLY